MPAALPTTVAPARARAVVGVARGLSGIAFALGLLGVLNTGIDDLGSDSAETLFVFLVHPITSILWLVIGLTGIAMATSPGRAQRFLAVVGPLLVVWALLALVTDGEGTQALARDPQLVALHLTGGLLAVAAALGPLPPSVSRVLERIPYRDREAPG